MGTSSKSGSQTGFVRKIAGLTLIGLPLVCDLAVLPQSAQAQATGAPPAAQNAKAASAKDVATTGEVVVTAQKFNSTVQKTPIAMTAVGNQQILAQGLADFRGLSAQVPGLSSGASGNGRSDFVIRGLSDSGGTSATVGFYLDETPVTPPSNGTQGKFVIDPSLYDLARVEVLRGPQGTLYGAGSMGGTIRMITNQPDPSRFDANAELIGSSTHGASAPNGQANFMLNLPIVDDKVALRIVGTAKYDDGFIERVVAPNFPLPNGDVRGDVAGSPGKFTVPDGGTMLDGGRISLLVKPVDRLSVTGSVFIQRIHSDNPSLADSTPAGRAFYQPGDIQEPSNDLVKIYSVVGKYALDFMDITSVTSVINRHTRQTTDTTEELQEAFGLPTFTPSSFLEKERTHEFNQELRFSSNGDGPLRWIVGGYYSDYHATDFQTGSFDGLEIGGTSNIFTGTRQAHITQLAGFGEATYQITPQIEVTAGIRGFHFRNTNTQAQYGIVANGSGDPASADLINGSAVASGVSPKVSIDYKPNSDLMLYATAAKGFRAGDSNFPVPVTGPGNCSANLSALGLQASPAGFAPDTVWSYEVGEKARLLDHRLTFNASAYYINWSNVQQTVFLGCGYRFIANEGNARSYGGEGEASFKITPWLTLQQTLSYNKSVLTADTPSTGGIKGHQLQNAPEWTAFSAIVVQRDLSDQWSLYARLQNAYTSAEFDNPIYGARPGYSIQSARIGLIGKEYSVFLFVDNLADSKAVLAHDYSIGVNIPQLSRNVIERPRTIGIDLQFHPL